MKIFTRIAVGILIVLLIVFLARLITQTGDKVAPIVRPHTVEYRTVTPTVPGSGVLRCATRAEIASKIEGRIEKILVDEGTEVSRETVLCHIVNDTIENLIALEQAELDKLRDRLSELEKPIEEQLAIKTAQHALDKARNDSEDLARQLENEKRIRQETPEIAMSQHEFEQLQRKVELARRDIELAEQKLEQEKRAIGPARAEARELVKKAQNELEDLKEKADARTVRPPVAGTVLQVRLTNNMLRSDPEAEYPEGTALFVVGALDTLRVEGTVFESDIGRIKEGQRVKVYPGTARTTFLAATLSTISLTPVGGGESGQFAVEIEFDQPPKGLKEGVRLQFDIVSAKAKHVLAVPVEYVAREAGRFVVRRVRGGTVETVAIGVGLSDNTYYEVTDGLSQGDIIVWESERR